MNNQVNNEGQNEGQVDSYVKLKKFAISTHYWQLHHTTTGGVFIYPTNSSCEPGKYKELNEIAMLAHKAGYFLRSKNNKYLQNTLIYYINKRNEGE